MQTFFSGDAVSHCRMSHSWSWTSMMTFDSVTEVQSLCVRQPAAEGIILMDWLANLMCRSICSRSSYSALGKLLLTPLCLMIKIPAGQMNGKLTSRHQVSGPVASASRGDLEVRRRPLGSADFFRHRVLDASRLQKQRAASGLASVPLSLCHLSHSVSVRPHFMSRPKAIG